MVKLIGVADDRAARAVAPNASYRIGIFLGHRFAARPEIMLLAVITDFGSGRNDG